MRTVGLAVLALATALGTTGCGDGVSKEDFSAEANEICADANRRARALGFEPPILTARQADYVVALTDIAHEAVDELGKLEPPEEDRRTIKSMLSAFERGLAKGKEIARASRMGDEQAFRAAVAAAVSELGKAWLEADLYGLDDCARLGRVNMR